MILTEKFYLFDVGVSNYLMNRGPKIGSPEFGKSFEHYLLMELRAYQAYADPEMEITYWRRSTGQEGDFILGNKRLSIEIKASARVPKGDIRPFQALLEDGAVKKCVVVSLEKEFENTFKQNRSFALGDFSQAVVGWRLTLAFTLYPIRTIDLLFFF